MKALRKGEIVEVEEIEPGDILLIENNGVPMGHVAIVQGTPKEWKGLYPDIDVDWDDDDDYWEDEDE